MVILTFIHNAVKVLVFLVLLATPLLCQSALIRLNQVGFLPKDHKSAVVISQIPLMGSFEVITAGKTVLTGKLTDVSVSGWGSGYPFAYSIDMTAIGKPGRYEIRLKEGPKIRANFRVGLYPNYHEELLFFMRQQRCGWNPYLQTACHIRDGKTFFGPMPDGTDIDATGGWHDAGDQLKYLITASNATARMLLAYELSKDKFADRVDDLGKERPNRIPDILDEAKWGLNWILKLHPAPDQLFHQVADDRDHRGFKLPQTDNVDYGWGVNSHRPVYFADAKPQGLGKWKSQANGIANLAGRSAAALAMASRIWKTDLKDPAFAEKCLRAAKELYEMGRRQEGYQQGNSFGAPYRYNEDTWADDMEWAGAELFRTTGQRRYLIEATRFAAMAAADSWMQFASSDMGEQMSRHYRKYPFTNIGHYALYQVADHQTKREIASFYREGLDRIVARATKDPFGIGIPFLWCSNNLVVAFITQALLYERMTGDRKYQQAATKHRDWLLGRNPWGTSMFTMIPSGGEFPEDVHLPLVQILKRQVPGGLVDGPIDSKTYDGLIGIKLNREDEFAQFHPSKVLYHDDVGDYATNEPTMDGTADAILFMSLLSRGSGNTLNIGKQSSLSTEFTYDAGGIIRGPRDRKRFAMVFTGDEFGEGIGTIADTLKDHGVKASFFFTGRFYRNAKFYAPIRRLLRSGHYLGAHSDEHLLYADWSDRSNTMISRADFEADLTGNYREMARFGIKPESVNFYIPPFEWYNAKIAGWANSLGLTIFSLTPGTKTSSDYLTPDAKGYIDSDSIMATVKDREGKDPNGLNGYILLIHVGTDPARTDKFYLKLGELLSWAKVRGYEAVRIDRLLSRQSGKL